MNAHVSSQSPSLGTWNRFVVPWMNCFKCTVIHGPRLADKTYPERSTVWQPDWKIGKDCKQPVCKWRLEGQIMGDLVDGQEQVLVCSGSNHVGCSQELPVEDRGVAEQVGTEELDGYDEEDNPFCKRLGAAQLRNLAQNT